VADFDDVAGLLDYPMYAVTTAAGDQRAGCLVGFTTQASIDPSRFLVGISVANRTHSVAQQAGRLAVHLLPADRRDLAELFGGETGDEVDKFARCQWRPGPDDVPVLDDAAAWFSGPIIDQIPLGDHVGFLLEPDVAEIRDRSARLLHFSQVRDLDPGHEA
jgi:flavin reductase (DIM6/NTAB) family NADH-FMN oxidoreductase RutF